MGFSRRRWNGGGTLASQPGPHFSGEMGEKHQGPCPWTPRGKSFFPPHPFLDCCRSGVSFLSAYLACGLKDQRLMARPPARAGGRSGLLTGGKKRETKRLLSAFSQRVPTHVSSPPSRWAGRYGPFTVRAAGQVTSETYSLPHTTPPEKGVPGRNLPPPGFFSPISSQEMGPRPGRPPVPPPFQRRRGKTPAPPPKPRRWKTPLPPRRP